MMRPVLLLWLLIMTLPTFMPLTGRAQEKTAPSTVTLSDRQENRYRDLIHIIRCPVCQGQSIGESNAGLAVDLRNIVRDMIVNHKSNDEIIAFMTERYGDFVTFEPPVKADTWLLWSAPWLLLLVVAFYFFRRLSRTMTKPSSRTEND